MPLRDVFGRNIVIIDRTEHARQWCIEERKKIAAERDAVRNAIHALKVRELECSQLEDEIARERRRAS